MYRLTTIRPRVSCADKGRGRKKRLVKSIWKSAWISQEKKAFKDAAELAGTGLSTWVRERLRIVARKELESADRSVAFLEKQG